MNGLKKSKEYIKKNLVLIVVIILFVAIIFPVILDVLDIGKCIPFYKNTSPDGWLGVIAALLGFSGIFITIKHTDKQFSEDKRISIKPYIHAEIERKMCVRHPDIKIKIPIKNSIDSIYNEISLGLTNIGLGPAIDFQIINIYSSKDIQLSMEKEILEVIDKEKFVGILLDIKVDMDEGYGKLKGYKFDTDMQIEEIKRSIRHKSRMEIYIDFKYIDVLNNSYRKTICIEIYIEPVYRQVNGNKLGEGEIKDFTIEATVLLDKESEEIIK